MTEENNTIQETEQLTFEQAFNQLEETVQKLETGNLPLEESLALYQRGMALAKQCGQQLDAAELTIEQLTPADDPVEFDDL